MKQSEQDVHNDMFCLSSGSGVPSNVAHDLLHVDEDGDKFFKELDKARGELSHFPLTSEKEKSENLCYLSGKEGDIITKQSVLDKS